jgi:hypothetical protein
VLPLIGCVHGMVSIELCQPRFMEVFALVLPLNFLVTRFFSHYLLGKLLCRHFFIPQFDWL